MIDICAKRIHSFQKQISNLLIDYEILYIRYARHQI